MHSSGKSVRPLWLYSGKVRSCGYSSEGVVVRPLGLLLNWPVELLVVCGLYLKRSPLQSVLALAMSL